jgi:hypothetical protein
MLVPKRFRGWCVAATPRRQQQIAAVSREVHRGRYQPPDRMKLEIRGMRTSRSIERPRGEVRAGPMVPFSLASRKYRNERKPNPLALIEELLEYRTRNA